jgi:4-hydroxybenzoate polyprenyltransferase
MNNYYDAESDKINPRRININAVASGKISKHNAIFLNIIFVFITLVVTILFKFEVFLFSIFLLFLGLSYSVPPFRLKGLPVLDVIWHFFGFFSIAIYGSYVAGSVGLINWLVAISLGVWSSVAQVGNHIADYSSDKNSGTRTFAVWIGLDKAKITISVLTFLHLIFLIPLVLLYSLSYWITILIVILIPLLGFLILRPIKGAFPTKRCYTFYFTVVIGGAVYISCIFYKIMLIMGIPSFDFLHLYGFP